MLTMGTWRRAFVLAGLLSACSGSPEPKLAAAPRPPTSSVSSHKARPAAPLPAPTPERIADARHLLNRFAFGPRPGEVERAAALGSERWLEQQFAAKSGGPELEAALAPHRASLLAPVDLVEDWLGPDGMAEMDTRRLREQMKPRFKEHLAHLASAELSRHILSDDQVREVMVDFWVNHFNVFAPKGFVRVFAGDYLERAVRPHALGRFSELLLATARHPAMLIYLDNANSVAPGAQPADAKKKGKSSGLNENYARELLELHTLGLDGGYTQADVIAVARVLTGWSVVRRGGKFEFVFHAKKHDAEPKIVLGQTFPAGGGEEEGVRLLEFLATHPATGKHLAVELCARFVSDDPPPSCVERAAAAFSESRGEIKAVLRAIVGDSSFWAAGARGAKLKSPIELVASAARALGAKPDGSTGLSEVLEKLGEPLLQERVPTGYPDAADEWTSSGGLLSRMNFASQLATQSLPGVKVDLDALLPRSKEGDLLGGANAALLSGQATPETLRIVGHELEGALDFEQRRALALALLLGSPEFQRQ